LIIKALSLLLINEGDDRATRTEKNYSNKLPGETAKVEFTEKDFVRTPEGFLLQSDSF
jgi:hypothetical protein